MRHLSVFVLLTALSTAPAFSQSQSADTASTPASTTLPADASNPSIDYAALREKLAGQNKLLTDQLATQRAIVKKNQDLLKEAQKLQATNLKLADEKKRLEAQNADLEKQRQALASSQKSAAE